MAVSRSGIQWRWARRFAALGLLASLGLGVAPARAFEVEVSEAPTDDLALTLSAIRGAQQSLFLNIYELSSSDIADALIERIQAGVQVEIIEEGQPVGGFSAASRGLEAQIVQAMKSAAGASDHFFEMHAQSGHKRRFRFDHGKYAVIDGERLLIGSENYSPTGNAQPGTQGNRGWEVLIHDPAIAQEFQQVFSGDSQLSFGDLTDLVGDRSGSLFAADRRPKPKPNPAPTTQPSAPQAFEATAVQRVTSPDSSLSGLLALINGATTTLDIEQMTFDSGWGNAGQSSPLYDAVLAAARRGVKVRVLLNDESVFDHPSHPSKHKNQDTADALNQAAQDGGLDLTVRIANLRAMGVTYIHNKGALANSDLTLISSINWDENSIEKNREAAVVLTSPEIHDHYRALFESDWQNSANGPDGSVSHLPGPELLVRRDAPLECPQALRLTARIGELDADADDDGFSSLSGATIADTFSRVPDSQDCLLADAAATSGHATSKAKFVQLRRRPSGEVLLSLEGYASGGKLYSVRATVADESALGGELQGGFYDASGPGHRKLGSAILEVSEAARR